MDLSPATRLAWQGAANEAMHQGSALLEPHHLLIGVCSVEKLLALESPGEHSFLKSHRNEIQWEASTWADALTEVGSNNRAIRRALRDMTTAPISSRAVSVTRVRRSPESQVVFARAEGIATAEQASCILLAHLAGALLEIIDERIDTAFRQLGKQKIDLQLALLRRNAPLVREAVASGADKSSGIEITQALDASSFPYSDNNQVSEQRSALLYELPLLFGSGGP